MMFIAGGIGGLMAELNTNYNNQGYNESKLDAYNKLANISVQTKELKEESLNLSSKSGVSDVLGGFFESAYNSMKIAFGSFDVFASLSNSIFDDVGIDRSEIYKVGLITIVIIMIVVGIIIAAAVKRDL